VLVDKRGWNTSTLISEPRYQVFFGTPHRALDTTGWEDLLLNIILASPLITASFIPNMATRIRGFSAFFEEVSTKFVSIPVRRCIVNVYQGLGANQIISRYSATTGLVHETNFSCPSDHQDLCKFSSDGPVFSAIADSLEAGKCFPPSLRSVLSTVL
jgi:hypothetical protein